LIIVAPHHTHIGAFHRPAR